MPYRPKKSAKTPAPGGELESDLTRSQKFAEQTRRNLATRSTLARLRNRKSALK